MGDSLPALVSGFVPLTLAVCEHKQAKISIPVPLLGKPTDAYRTSASDEKIITVPKLNFPTTLVGLELNLGLIG